MREAMAATRNQSGLHKRTRHDGKASALREKLFAALSKLNTHDTCRIGFDEIHAIAGSLSSDGVPQCLSLVLEHRLKQVRTLWTGPVCPTVGSVTDSRHLL